MQIGSVNYDEGNRKRYRFQGKAREDCASFHSCSGITFESTTNLAYKFSLRTGSELVWSNVTTDISWLRVSCSGQKNALEFGMGREPGTNTVGEITGITTITAATVKTDDTWVCPGHPPLGCSISNGDCQDLCLPREGGVERSCSCKRQLDIGGIRCCK
eukprot:sb/3472978/